MKKPVLNNFVIFSKKPPWLQYTFNEVSCLKTYNFIAKRFLHSCFPGKIAKFFATPLF